MTRTIYFIARSLPRSWPELDHPRAALPLGAVPPRRWGPGENIWVVSTYLRLRARGNNVAIRDRVVPGRINVAYDDRVLRDLAAPHSFIVALFGDRNYRRWGQFNVVQSPAMLTGRMDEQLMPMWPQPNLLPRSRDRNTQLDQLAYLGPPQNLAPPFHTPAFRHAMARIGIHWHVRTDPQHWHDHRHIDALLAVRDLSPAWLRTKPATKLTQAWLTGCLPLLGPEPAYRFTGTPGADHIEVTTPDDVLDALRRFKHQPALLRRMLDAGAERAPDFDENAIANRWEAMLNGPVQRAYQRWLRTAPHRRTQHAVTHHIDAHRTYIARKWFFLNVKHLPGRQTVGTGSSIETGHAHAHVYSTRR